MTLRAEARRSKNTEDDYLARNGHAMRWTATRVWHSIRGAGYDGECRRCHMTAVLFRDPWGGYSRGFTNAAGRPVAGGAKCRGRRG